LNEVSTLWHACPTPAFSFHRPAGNSGPKDNIRYNRAKKNTIRSKIAVIAFDGITPFHLSVPSLIFGNSHDTPGVPAFEVRTCAIDKGPLRTTAGFSIAIEFDFAALSPADIVIEPA
jgi:transcriptional regulator GlxA family with amidase domain